MVISSVAFNQRRLSSFFKFAFVFFIFIESHANENRMDFDWLDKDKKVYVLQNRKYRKDSSLFLNASYARNLSSKFLSSQGGFIGLSYFFTEDWGIEGTYAILDGSENTTAKGVIEQNAVPFYRSITNYSTVSLMWSPFYGKFNTFDLIYYLDWFVGLGFASVNTEDNRNRFSSLSDTSLSDETNSGLTWTTGFWFHLGKLMALRIDFRGIHYQADLYRERGTSSTTYTESKWFHNYDLNLGLTFKF